MLTSKGARPEISKPAATSNEPAIMGRVLTTLPNQGLASGLAHRAKGHPITAPVTEPERLVATSMSDVMRVGVKSWRNSTKPLSAMPVSDATIKLTA
jgi:hypothetical protein